MEAKQLAEESNARIETELEVRTYLQKLRYALRNGAKIDFQIKTFVMSFHYAEKAFTPDMFPYRK